MSVFNRIKNIFSVVTVSSAVDYENIPMGFFRVVASGKVTRGYRGSFINWCVGKIVVDGAQRHTCETPLEELPTVRLNYQNPQNGAHVFGGHTVIDTDSLDGDDGTVAYIGSNSPRESWV